MFGKLAVKLGAKVITNPAILVEWGPVIIPVVAIALICDAVDGAKK